jgi:ribosomal protein S6
VRWRNSHIHEKQKRKVNESGAAVFEKKVSHLFTVSMFGVQKLPFLLRKQNLCICFKNYFTFHTQAPHNMTHKIIAAAALDPNFLRKSSLTANINVKEL